MKWGLCICVLLCLLSCEEGHTIKEKKPWRDPLVTTYNAETLLSDSATVKVRVYGKVSWQYENNNLTYPEGVKIELFNKKEKQTKLVADSAYVDSNAQKYIAIGNVVMNNYPKKITLKTEKLIWDRTKKKVVSDTDVSITQNNQIIYGHGFEAYQDLKRWKITKVKGIIPLSGDE